MRKIQDIIAEKPWLAWAFFGTTIVVVFIVGLLAASIIERRSEANFLLSQVKPIADWEPRNEVWGENFPRQYESYLNTLDTNFASKHGGSKTIDYLEKYPELVILWAGYAFSKDYNQGRGHAYAVKDIRSTLRTGGEKESPMPATCWTCKSTDVPRLMNEMGTANYYKEKWKNLGEQVVNPIGCQDCHNPKTMDLRISRPALVEAFQRKGIDITKASHNEMRNLVCAQCHVEYYFKGKEEKYLTFPWDNGMDVESMEKYYDDAEFSDWTHKLSKTPMIKAQHPDYEIFTMGVHYKRGVTCADCHMPYKREGGVKFTNHHIVSPLSNIENSCFVCHREKTDDLVTDVYERQDKYEELRMKAEKEIAAAHIEAKAAWDNGATDVEMKSILKLIRQAQWRWDWIAAANGMAFHAPVEGLRVIALAIEKAKDARKELALLLTKKGKYPIQMPDISSKEKAQAFIGFDMNALRADKNDLLSKSIPEWDRKAKERQGSLNTYEK